MIYRTFVYTDADSIVGWLPDRAPASFSPGGPVLVVHDLMEHLPGLRSGSVPDELQALGVMLRVRADGGYFRHRAEPNPAVHLGHDLDIVLEDEEYWNEHTVCPPALRAFVPDWVQACTHKATENVYCAEKARAWIHRGYVKGCKTYSNLSAARLADISWMLETEVGEASEMAQEGDRMRLGVCPQTGKTCLKMQERRYDY